MNIEMKRSAHPDAKRAGKPNPQQVWWWQVVDDAGERIHDGVGWEFKKTTAYAVALKAIRVEKDRQRADA